VRFRPASGRPDGEPVAALLAGTGQTGKPDRMRALFVASPLVGHVLPLVPLATAFRDAGHEVMVATGADGGDAARRAGLPVHDVAPGVHVGRIFGAATLRHPIHLLRMIAGDSGTEGVGIAFAAVTATMADGTIALADDWQPDLVLHEGLAPAGGLAAGRRGVPSVLVDAIIFDGRRLFDAVTSHLDGLARRHGVDGVPAPADLVTAIPPSLVGERHGRPMRYVPAAGHGVVPERLTRSGSRPVVLVSRSTVADPRPDRMMTSVVAAAAGADVDVVLVRPDRAVGRRPLPPNVTATDWLPFADVLPHVGGIVHHGGAGTVMTALAAGVPQIVVPGSGDRTEHARLIAARGAGLAVPLREMTAASLERLVGDAALASAAREVAAEIAAMPDPAELVEPLVALTR
jgi:UDP:flavonoid glycosyltransferase YjiC (YdhE family)